MIRPKWWGLPSTCLEFLIAGDEARTSPPPHRPAATYERIAIKARFGALCRTRTGPGDSFLNCRFSFCRLGLDKWLDGGPQGWYTTILSVRYNPLMYMEDSLRRDSPLWAPGTR